MKRILPLLLCLLCAGCPTQNQASALVGIAGTAIASLETIEGHTAAAAKIQTDFAAAQTAVLNWKAGTPTQDVAQALDLVIIDLDLLPVSDKDKAYIVLASGTVKSVLLIFQPASQARAAQAGLVSAPLTASEFRARFNALTVSNPVAGLKPLK